jgi:hypothetical protein
MASGQAGHVITTAYGWQDAECGFKGAVNGGYLGYVRDEDTARLLGLKGEAPLTGINPSTRSGVDGTARSLGLKGDGPLKGINPSDRDGAERKILTAADLVKRGGEKEQRGLAEPERAFDNQAPRGPGPLLGPVHVPDRRVSEMLLGENATVLQRLKGRRGTRSKSSLKSRSIGSTLTSGDTISAVIMCSMIVSSSCAACPDQLAGMDQSRSMPCRR